MLIRVANSKRRRHERERREQKQKQDFLRPRCELRDVFGAFVLLWRIAAVISTEGKKDD
jgi:hypothetical protein